MEERYQPSGLYSAQEETVMEHRKESMNTPFHNNNLEGHLTGTSCSLSRTIAVASPQ